MAEYIEREATIASIENVLRGRTDEKGSHAYLAFSMFAELIKIAPTADVVEVVRCKDCQYGKGEDHEGSIKVPFMYHCTYDDLSYNGADHYCSYGKRKEGAEE